MLNWMQKMNTELSQRTGLRGGVAARLVMWLFLVGIVVFGSGGQALADAVSVETVTQPYLGIEATFGRWNTPIPWVYNPTAAPQPFTDQDKVLRLLKDAMAEWEGVCGIHFDFKGVDSSRTIRDANGQTIMGGVVVVQWGGISSAGAAGPGRSYSTVSAVNLGYDPYTEGRVELNKNSQVWSDKRTPVMAEGVLRGTLVHELGHLIGLGHSDNPASVMYANPYNGMRHLLEDDIAAAQALYGPSSFPTTVARPYLPPTTKATVSPFSDSFLYLGAADTVRVTEIGQAVPDGDSLFLKLAFRGPVDRTVEVHTTDPFGYEIEAITVPLSCPAGNVGEIITCMTMNSIGSAGILKGIPGKRHVYVTANDELLLDLPFNVTGAQAWNRPPQAKVDFSTTSGLAPLEITAKLSATDPDGHGLSAIWHIPGVEIVNSGSFSGQLEKKFTFDKPGVYTVFIEVNDNGPRYTPTSNNIAGGPVDYAGLGMQTLLRQVVTVADTGTVRLVAGGTGRGHVSSLIPVRKAGDFPALKIAGSDGKPLTTPYALSFLTPDGGLGWRVDNIPAGVTDIVLGKLPAGATEVAPYITSGAMGTYAVVIQSLHPDRWGEVGSGTGTDAVLWLVESGSTVVGDQVAFTIGGLSAALPAELPRGYFGCEIRAGEQRVLNLAKYDGSASFAGKCVIPSGMASADWQGSLFYAVDSNADGAFDDSDLQINEQQFTKSDAASKNNQYSLSIGGGSLAGAVRFVDQNGVSVAAPKDTIVQVELDGTWPTAPLAADGSFAMTVRQFLPSGVTLDLTKIRNVSVLRDVAHDGWSGSDYVYFGAQSMVDLGSLAKPMVVLQAKPIKVPVAHIGADEQWVFMPTGQVVTAGSNVIDGTIWVPTPQPPDSWWGATLFLDRNKNGVRDGDEGEVYVGDRGLTTAPLSVANVGFLTFHYTGFKWFGEQNYQIAIPGWNGGQNNVSDDGGGMGSGVYAFTDPTGVAAAPTKAFLYKDVNKNGQLDDGESFITLALPASKGRFIDYAEVIGKSQVEQMSTGTVPTNHAPIVTNAINGQVWGSGTNSFKIPVGTFADFDQGETLTYKATLSDGSALPSGVTFDPATQTFTGGALATSATIQVTATDSHGKAVSNTFALYSATDLAGITAAVDRFMALFANGVPGPLSSVDRNSVFASDYFNEWSTDPNELLQGIASDFAQKGWSLAGVRFTDMTLKKWSAGTGAQRITFKVVDKNGTVLVGADAADPADLWLIREAGTWKIFGEPLGASLKMFSTVGNGGYRALVFSSDYHPASGVDYVVVSGPGFQGDAAVRLLPVNDSAIGGHPHFVVDVNKNGVVDFGEQFWTVDLDDARVRQMEGNGVYTYTYYSSGVDKVIGNGDDKEMRRATTTLKTQPPLASELSVLPFPTITAPSVASLAAFNTGPLAVSWSLATGTVLREVTAKVDGTSAVGPTQFFAIEHPAATATSYTFNLNWTTPLASRTRQAVNVAAVRSGDDSLWFFKYLEVSLNGGSGGGNQAPMVAKPLATQIWSGGGSKSLQIPVGTFIDPEAGALSYKMTLGDGSALPAWLSFNTATQTLAGTPPAGASDLKLLVTATDAGGKSVSMPLVITFGNTGGGATTIRVTGTVLLDGVTGNAGSVVRFWPVGVANAPAVSPNPKEATDANGAFAVDLVPGSYKVEIQPKGSGSVWLGRSPGGKQTVEMRSEGAAPLFIDTGSNQTLKVQLAQGQTVALVEVSGVVQMGAVVAGAEVRFTPFGVVDAPAMRGVTDTTGLYHVNVAPGPYRIEIQLPDKAPLFLGMVLNATGSGPGTVVVESRPEKAFGFFVGQGQWTRIDVTLPPDQVVALVQLSGVVTLDTVAVSGATVRLAASGTTAALYAKAMTDAGGQYVLSVAPGLYKVEVYLPGKAPLFLSVVREATGTEKVVAGSRPEQAADFFVGADGWSKLDVKLTSAQAVAMVGVGGTVKTGDVAEAGAEVRLFQFGVEKGAPFVASTDAVGKYHLDVAPGLYGVEVQLPGKAGLFLSLVADPSGATPGKVVATNDPAKAFGFLIGKDGWSVIDVVLAPNQAQALLNLRGTVKIGESVVAGAEVRLWPEGVKDAAPIKTVTDAKGGYDVNVPPGVYRVEVQPPGKQAVFIGVNAASVNTPVAQAEMAFPFAVGGGNSTAGRVVDLAIPDGAVKVLVGVKGLVQIEDKTVTPAGLTPVAGAVVVLKPVGMVGAAGSKAVTDADGRYDLNIAPGVYTVEVQPVGAAILFVGKEGVPTANPQEAGLFQVLADKAGGNQINLTIGKASVVALVKVSGTIQMQGSAIATTSTIGAVTTATSGSKSVPAVGAKVYLAQVGDAQNVWETTTGGAGEYSVDLPPGVYRVQVQVQGAVAVFVARDAVGLTYPSKDVQKAATFDFRANQTGGNVVNLLLSTVDVVVQGKLTGGIRKIDLNNVDLKLAMQTVAKGAGGSVGDGGVGDAAVAADKDGRIAVAQKVATQVVAGAEVRVWPVGVENAQPIKKTTDGGGQFAVDAAPGVYKVEVQIPGSTPIFVGRNQQGKTYPAMDPKEAVPFDVKGGAVATVVNLDLGSDVVQELAQVYGMLTLAAVDGSKQPMAGVELRFWRQGEADARAVVAMTDGDGRYALGLAVGGYVVEAVKPGFAAVFVGKGKDANGSGQWVPVSSREQAYTFFIAAKDAAGQPVKTEVSLVVGAGAVVKLAGLSGNVTLDGKPILGAVVRVYAADAVVRNATQEVATISGGGDAVQKGATGADGGYALSLAPGIYKVEVVVPGFVGVFNGAGSGSAVLTWARDKAAIVNVKDVLVTHSFSLVSTTLAKTVEIRGRIARLDGTTVAGVTLQIHPVDDLAGKALFAVTGEDGGYAVSVSPGLYQVEVVEAGFAGVYPSQFDPRVVTPDQASAAIYDVRGAVVVVDVVLDQSMGQAMRLISGRVTTDGTQPIFGAEVQAVSKEEGKPPVVTLTDAEGRYKLSVSPGFYQVGMMIPGFAPLYPSGNGQKVLTNAPENSMWFAVDQADVKVDIVKEQAASGNVVAVVELSGVVNGASGSKGTVEALRGVEVVAHRYDVSSQKFAKQVVAGLTDEDGRYRLQLIPGNYALELKVPGFASVTPSKADEQVMTSDPQEAKLYDVRADWTIDMLFHMKDAVQPAEIVGRLRAGGQAVVGARIFALPPVGAVVLDHFEDVTDSEGRFTIPVKPGKYTIEVSVPGFDTAFVAKEGQTLTPKQKDAQVYDVQKSTQVDIELVGGGAAAGTELSMKRKGVTLKGKVTGANGAGVAGVQVAIQPDFDPDLNSNGVWENAVTLADGSFSVSVLPGRYRIEILTKYWDEGTQEEKVVLDADQKPLNLINGFVNGQGGVDADQERANVFTIFADKTVNVKMEAGVALSGHVLKGDGGGVGGAMVNVHSLDSQSTFWVETGVGGAFAVNVNPGKNYVIEVWPKWCDEQANDFSTCDQGRAKFMGGNLIVTSKDVVDIAGKPLVDAAGKSTVMTRTAQNEPVIVASVANTVGAVIGGKILGIWEPQKVTQFKVDQSLHLMLTIDAGKSLAGRLVKGNGLGGVVGVAGAWVDSGLGGTPTDKEGLFKLILPSSGGTDEAGQPVFDLHIWPPWCDAQADGAELELCKDNQFMGGVVVAADGGVYRLASDEAHAVRFQGDGSDWPTQNGLTVTVGVGVTITGRVVDGSQKGVPNVWVDAWSHDTTTGSGIATGADGTFSIRVEPPSGQSAVYYEMSIWAPGFIAPDPVLAKVEAKGLTGVYKIKRDESGLQGVPMPGDPLDVTATPSVKFALSKGNSIKGRVVDATGKGLPWVWVDIHDRQNTKFFGASTDERGFYEATVTPGRYLAVVWGDGDSLRTTWYNQAADERDATLVDVTSGSKEGVYFRMSSGATISGTITGGTSGQVSIGVWSERTQSGGKKEVTLDASGTTTFTIAGLREAKDYRLQWHSERFMSGFYGGTLAGAASAPVSWNGATLLNTSSGHVTGVNIAVSSGKTLTLTVTDMKAGEKVSASVWSDALDLGGWSEGVAGSGGIATLLIKDLDSSGKDYRLFVESAGGGYKKGNYKKSEGATTEAGTLVGWDQATLLDLASDLSVSVAMESGGSIAGTVRGLPAGQVLWVEAASQRTRGWSGAEVTAGADGTAVYTLQGLKRARDYRVSISGDGVKGGFYAGPGSTKLTRWNDAAEVDIRSANATGIDMVVSSGVAISGSVKGVSEGGGLQSGEWAWVDAWSDSAAAWAGTTIEASKESSGASVTYKLDGLASAADYKVHLDAGGYVQQTKGGVDATTSATGVDFILTTGGKVDGSISGLKSAEFVWVEAFSPATGQWGGAGVGADANGTAAYTIDGLSAATDYVVSLQSEGKTLFYSKDGVTPVRSKHSDVVVASGTTTGIDFNLTAAASLVFNLSGTVTLNPVSSDQMVEIMAWSADGVGTRTSRIGGGKFILRGLPSGSYTVEVVADGYIPRRTKTVAVVAGVVDGTVSTWTNGWGDVGTVAVTTNTSGLDVTLSTGFTLSGKVTDASGAVSGVWVNAWDEDSAVGAGAATDSSGAYSINGLPRGEYKVDVWTRTGKISATKTVTANTTQDLTIARQAGGISGAVVSSSNVAKQGVMVLVYDGTKQVAATATDGKGEFKVEGLADGSYDVKVFGDDHFSQTVSFAEKNAVVVTGSTAAVGSVQLSAP